MIRKKIYYYTYMWHKIVNCKYIVSIINKWLVNFHNESSILTTLTLSKIFWTQLLVIRKPCCLYNWIAGCCTEVVVREIELALKSVRAFSIRCLTNILPIPRWRWLKSTEQRRSSTALFLANSVASNAMCPTTGPLSVSATQKQPFLLS